MKKNILIIICDQLSALALRTYGNTYDRTENINRLAQEGAVFENAYCNSPLCQPSRASFWTSRWPHETGVNSNNRRFEFPEVSAEITTLGESFSEAGYQTWHFGKEHDYGTLRGFKKIESVQRKIPREDPAITLDYETFLDIDTTEKVVDWLRSDEPEKTPFLTVADLQNPHNICFYVRDGEEGTMAIAGDPELPELPDNFDTPDMINRPEFIQYLCCGHRRLKNAAHWSELDYRRYLYAYHYYLARVDKQIGEILETLEQQSLEDSTLVVFMADHGEGMAAHRMVTKYGCFYEESLRVPFIFRGPHVQAGLRVGGVASLIDLKPTLLGYAGLEADPDDRGEDLSQVLSTSDLNVMSPVDHVVSTWHDEFEDYTVPGRMFRFDRYKYIAYRDYESRDSQTITIHEELYDLETDPGEQQTLVVDATYHDVLRKAREGLKEHVAAVDDPFFESMPHYDQGIYRQHAPGYWNHQGYSAVEVHVAKRDGKPLDGL